MTGWIGEVGSEVQQHLRELQAKGSPGFAAQVAEAFLRDTATRLIALQDAIARRDGDATCRVAHTIQGSGAMMGAASLARSCAELGTAARGGAFDRCEGLLAELTAAFDAIQLVIKSEDSSDSPR